MSSDQIPPTIDCAGLGKAYKLYERPHHRLFELCGLRSPDRTPQRWAIRGVNLRVSRGECVGIVGVNGAGKSTLLQMIAGTVRATEGSVAVRGRVAALLELNSGFNPELTGRENIGLRAAVLGLTNTQIRERTEDIIAFSDIGTQIDNPIRTYSTGMQARLAFAIAAHVDADVLIVDETLAVGDGMFVQKCMRWIRAFRARGTLLFVSHSTQLVIDLCDRAVWLQGGSVVEDGPAKDVVRSYAATVHAGATGQQMIAGRGLDIPTARASEASVNVENPQSAAIAKADRPADDARHEAIRQSGLEAVMDGMRFNPEADWWGRGGAVVESVKMLDSVGNPRGCLPSDGLVTVEVMCRAIERLDHPVVGYSVVNSRGLVLFADNSWLAYGAGGLPAIDAGHRFVTRFKLRIPALPAGEYALGGAVANGTPGAFVQHHRSDNTVLFRVASSHLVEGIVGVPMLQCTMEVMHRVPTDNNGVRA